MPSPSICYIERTVEWLPAVHLNCMDKNNLCIRGFPRASIICVRVACAEDDRSDEQQEGDSDDPAHHLVGVDAGVVSLLDFGFASVLFALVHCGLRGCSGVREIFA